LVLDRYRLIASIVVLFVYLLAMYPLQTISVAVILLIVYLVIRNLNADNTEQNGETMRRQSALAEAKIYLAPYSDIWKNLKLSNKYCIMRLGSDGRSIKAYDCNDNRSFKVVKSRIHNRNDLWNMFCMSFSHNTTFDELVKLCDKFYVDIQLSDNNSGIQKNNKNIIDNSVNTDFVKTENIITPPKEKLDINNASEVELTALPGISIVMSKKLIKKREDIGGFKSVKDVFLFLQLKPHIQSQLENLICVKKMKGSVKIKRYNERSIDL